MSLNKITVRLTVGENTHEGEVTRAVNKKEFRYRIKWKATGMEWKNDTKTTETLDPTNYNNSSSEDCWTIPKETDRLLYTGSTSSSTRSVKSKKRKSTAISSGQTTSTSKKKRKVIKEEEIELTPEQRASQHQKLKQVLLKHTTNKKYKIGSKKIYKTYAKEAFWLNEKDIANLHGTAAKGKFLCRPATKFSKNDVVMCAVHKYQTVQQWTDVVAKKAAAKKARAANKGNKEKKSKTATKKVRAANKKIKSKSKAQTQTQASLKCPHPSCSNKVSLKCCAPDRRHYCGEHCPGCSKHKKKKGTKIYEYNNRQIPSSRSTSSSSSNSNSKPHKNSLSSTKKSATDGQIFERLLKILKNSTRNPSGPSEQENVLMARVEDFQIIPYGYEVELGNGVCDCVGFDRDYKLCVVEAKCIHKQKNTGTRHKEVREQTNAYATFLAQQTHADVVAYCFDDEGGVLALERIGVYEYERVKDDDPRKKS